MLPSLSNPDYERALVGAILLDNKVLEEHSLTETLFDDKFSRRVFAEIVKARGRGAEANIMEVALMMPDEAAAISELTSGSAANAGYYYKQIRELARRRGLVAMAKTVAERALEGTTSDDLMGFIDKAVSQISEMREVGYTTAQAYMPQVIKEIEAAWRSRDVLTGVTSGFPGIDKITNGWQKGTSIIIGARPGTGKTSLALNMSSAALRSGHKVGFFSAEMSGPSIIKRMISDWSRVKHDGILNGTLSRQDLESIMVACQDIAGSALHINDTPAITLQALVADARKMKRREGIQVLFVDYMSLITSDRRDLPRHEQVAEISKAMKSLARELDIPVIVLSQLTREAQDSRPSQNQLRDSGSVEQDADMVILLQHLGYVDEAHSRIKINLIISKNRNGATADVAMEFTAPKMRFAQIEGKWQEEEKPKRRDHA